MGGVREELHLFLFLSLLIKKEDSLLIRYPRRNEKRRNLAATLAQCYELSYVTPPPAPQIHMLKFSPPGTQNVTVFGGRAFKEVIKVK